MSKFLLEDIAPVQKVQSKITGMNTICILKVIFEDIIQTNYYPKLSLKIFYWH